MKARKTASAVGACVAAAAALLVTVTPASATILERSVYTNHYEFSYDDCGFPVDVAGDVEQRYRIRTGTGPDEGAFFLRNRYSLTETQTNPETGAFVTIEAHDLYNEVKASRLSGSVFEFAAIDAGQPFSLYDSNGDLVLRDRGSIRFRVVFDTLGDDEPGGEVVTEFDPRLNGPHPSFDADWCAIIAPLIGS
jgi:hypothetical protein